MSELQQYHGLLQKVLNEGELIYNKRTNYLCKVLIGEQLTFNIKNSFPALTTRKLPFLNILGELLGFFRGVDNAKDFRDLGCNFWSDNANKTQSWLDNRHRKGADDLGRIYGVQWTSWSDKVVTYDLEEVEQYKSEGYKLILSNGVGYVLERNINQLERAVKTILTNPSDRRILIQGWNTGELDRMALPPCHVSYNFIPFEHLKVLNVVMSIRSADLFLGTPANIASTALFLEVMSRLTGYTPGKVIIQLANAHIYENHYEQVEKLLTRGHFVSPRLILGNNIRMIEDLRDIPGCFTRINVEDFKLVDYVHHEPISAVMAI